MRFLHKHVQIRFLLVGAFICSSSILYPAGPQRGFEALEIYDYFKARKVFLKKVKAHPTAANFGLSIITGRNDNPFHNVDSAFLYIKRAQEAFGLLALKKRSKLERFQLDSIGLVNQLHDVQGTGWAKAQTEGRIESYDHFIDFFGTSQYRDSAIWARSAHAFSLARETDSQESYTVFLETYPAAAERIEAKNRLDAVRFRDYTAKGDLAGNLNFLKDYPESAYASQAQDNVYELSVSGGTSAQLAAFVKTYPSNRNVNRAWRGLYVKETLGAGQDAIANFKRTYPDYPFLSELGVDLETAARQLFPFVKDGFWGFIDNAGVEGVQAAFEWVEAFEGPQAVVSKHGKVGTIDRAGKTVIPIEFDAIESLGAETTIAERNGKMGLVDRSGKTLIPFEYTDLGEPSEGLVYAEKEGKYGFLNTLGETIIPFQFEDAREFVDGRAICGKDGMLGMINRSGEAVIPHKYQFLEQYVGKFARARTDTFFNLLDRFGNELLEGKYVHIAPFSYPEGLAFVLDQDGKVGYIDTLGSFKIPAIYNANGGANDNAVFKNGYAVVRKSKGKFGSIDTAGTVVLPFQYVWIGEMSEGLVAVERTKGKRYFVDLDNKRLSETSYQWLWPFENGFAKAINLDGAHLLVRSDGREVLFENCTAIGDVADGIAAVQVAGKYGLYSLPNEVVLTNAYTVCTHIGANLWKLELDKKWAYYRSDLRKFIWIQEGFPFLLD